MKKIVIDINIFMDFLFRREGNEKAAEIFRICSEGTIKGFVCAHEITTLYYFLNKTTKNKRKIKKSISGIIKYFEIIETGREILTRALASEINDFEDAVIETSAIIVKADYILTRNIKDFKKSMIKPVTPEVLLAALKQTRPSL